LGGQGNTASESVTTIGGGQNNSASNCWSSVLGGCSNAARGLYSTVGGGCGNRACTYGSTVAGGSNNFTYDTPGGATITSYIFQTVGGGKDNCAWGTGSVIPGGCGNVVGTYGYWGAALGTLNTVTGTDGAAAVGAQNTVSNAFSSALGARSTASGYGSWVVGVSSCATERNTNAFGEQGVASMRNQKTFGSTGYGSGKNQFSFLTAWRSSTSLSTGASLVLSLDGTGTTNLIIPAGNRAWNVTIKNIGMVIGTTGTTTGVSTGDTYMQNDVVLFKRRGSTSTLVSTVQTLNGGDTGMATSAITYSVGASGELSITFTAPTFAGGGTLSIRTSAKIELVEVAE
jgi:hypothetical protein